ncbi:MAG: hypothetical protein JWO36_1514 [Myxococcales bacterium]|nr:hypothetical protein [Myxococcales bacterium]
MLAPELVDVMVCPKSKQAVVYFPRGEADRDEADAFVLCPASRLRYRIDDGVPVFLIEEATELAPAEVERLVRRARELQLHVP